MKCFHVDIKRNDDVQEENPRRRLPLNTNHKKLRFQTLVNLWKRKDLSRKKQSPLLQYKLSFPFTSKTESAEMTIQHLFRQGHHVPYLLALQVILIILFVVFVDYYDPAVRDVTNNQETAGNLSSNSSDGHSSSHSPVNDNELLEQLYPSKNPFDFFQKLNLSPYYNTLVTII